MADIEIDEGLQAELDALFPATLGSTFQSHVSDVFAKLGQKMYDEIKERAGSTADPGYVALQRAVNGLNERLDQVLQVSGLETIARLESRIEQLQRSIAQPRERIPITDDRGRVVRVVDRPVDG